MSLVILNDIPLIFLINVIDDSKVMPLLLKFKHAIFTKSVLI